MPCGCKVERTTEKRIILRNPKNGKMSRHFQIETNMSLSGANADNRIQIKPSEQAYLISNLYKALIASEFCKNIVKIAIKQTKARWA